MESSQILGVRIDHISKNHIRNVIRQKLSEKKFCHIATVNPEFLVTASHNKNFKKILYQTDINICDGIGISIFGKLLYGKKIDRIPGVELAELILREAEKMNKSVFLLGGKGVVDIVEQKICSKYKKIRIVGKIDGDDKTFEVVQKTNPDVILVAFGAPKQEIWLSEKGRKITSLKLGIGVGGTFDFWAGKIKRAPILWRKIGLEWLWRLIQEPQRWRRIFNAIVVFPYRVIQEKIYRFFSVSVEK